VGGHIAEVLRRLDQGNPAVVEIAQGLFQDVRLGDLVRVQDQQEFAVRDHQGVVQVAGLGMARHVGGPVLAARHIAQPVFFGEGFQLEAGAVVENPGAVRVPDFLGGQGRGHDHVQVFVVRGDEDINGGIGGRRGCCLADLELPHGHTEQHHVDQAVGLGHHQRHGNPPGIPVERGRPAPAHVVQAQDDGQNHHQAGPETRHTVAGSGRRRTTTTVTSSSAVSAGARAMMASLADCAESWP
jgi:hypothetical protein